MLYTILKQVHQATVVASICGFVLRGFWMLIESPLLEHRATRTLPHVNDTVLLISAVWLSLLIQQYPFVNSWLTAKLLGLLAYIILGMYALTRGQTRAGRTVYLVLAVVVFCYVASVALHKNPLGFICMSW